MAPGRNAVWPQIILIYLVGIFGMLVVAGAVPALGGIAGQFRPLSPATIGWVMSMPALAAALFSLLIGALVDRLGDRVVMLAGCAIVIAADAGVVMAGSMGVLLACRLVGGIGYVCMVVAAVTMISRLTTGAQRTAALALWSTVIPASFIVAALYSTFTADTLGWQVVFMAHGMGCAALAAGVVAMLPRADIAPGGASRLRGVAQVLRTPWPFVLGLSFAAAAFLQTGFVAALPGMLARSIAAPAGTIHAFNALAMACNVVGAFSFGLLYNRGIKAWYLGSFAVALCAVSGVALIVSPLALAPAIAMNCLLMLGLGLLVGMWAFLPLVAPSLESMGATSGLITQVTLLGVLFGPPAAMSANAHGVPATLLYLTVGVVLSTVSWPIWRRGARRTAAA